MPRNGSGTFSLAQPPFIPGSTISSTSVNSDLSDVAAALTTSIASDGQTTITGQLKFPSGSAISPSHTFAADLTSGMYFASSKVVAISAGGIPAIVMDTNNIGVSQSGALLQYGNGAVLCPVGAVIDWAGGPEVIKPLGWLLCFGQAVGRLSYPELFSYLQTTYGSGDGSTTFNLPDCRGRNTVGKDDMGGVAAGRVTAAGSGITGTTLGAAGGGQSIVLSSANLPAIQIAVTVTITDPGHVHVENSNISGAPVLGSGTSFGTPGQPLNTDTAVTGITASGLTGFLGSGTQAASMNPSIIMNKLIFAGRP